MEEKKEIAVKAPKNIIVKVKIKSLPGSTLLMQKKSDLMKIHYQERYGNKKRVKGMMESKAFSDKEIAESKIHYTSDGKFGFPARAIQLCLDSTARCKEVEGISGRIMSSVKILGDIIPFTKVKRIEDNVSWGVLSGRTRAPTKIVRPQFKDWEMELNISFDKTLVNPITIINLLNIAGGLTGIGSFRPERKGGNHGMFQVAGGKIPHN